VIVSLVPLPSAPSAPADALQAHAEFAATLATTADGAMPPTAQGQIAANPATPTEATAPSLIPWLAQIAAPSAAVGEQETPVELQPTNTAQLQPLQQAPQTIDVLVAAGLAPGAPSVASTPSDPWTTAVPAALIATPEQAPPISTVQADAAVVSGAESLGDAPATAAGSAAPASAGQTGSAAPASPSTMPEPATEASSGQSLDLQTIDLGTTDSQPTPSPSTSSNGDEDPSAPIDPLDAPDAVDSLEAPDPVPSSAATATTAPQPAALTSRPVIESATLQRVEAALEQLENSPPPRTLVLDIGEAGGLRIRLSSTADGVQVDVQSDRGERDPAWEEGLRRSLAERGFDLDHRRDQGEPETGTDSAQPQPNTTAPTRPADTAVRL